ncbi:unnamed protein product [Cylicostephanus goldi]|uniref:Uncharacterized protein n=1 Tax=Cylicostephanus goldi TaxID=71465 RepID=A0A3P6T3K9_CYLGO|nr:unnamed protein product [Cylicostephanus goldi]
MPSQSHLYLESPDLQESLDRKDHLELQDSPDKMDNQVR